jgi:hypothetical protein
MQYKNNKGVERGGKKKNHTLKMQKQRNKMTVFQSPKLLTKNNELLYKPATQRTCILLHHTPLPGICYT